jgi:hypothetical protein
MEDSIPASTSPSKLQFSLRSLFVGLAMVCLLLAPTRWFGGLYLFSVVLSAGLVLFCVSRYRGSARLAILAAVFGVPVAMFFGTIVFLLHSLCNLGLCVLLAAIGVQPKAFAVSLATLMLVIYGVVLCHGAAEVRRLTMARAQFPFRSLVERLAFEKLEPGYTPSEPSAQLAGMVSFNLNEQDERLDRSISINRVWALRQLHESTYLQFAVAAGFGPARMPYLSHNRVELEPRTPLKVPVSVAIDTTQTGKLDVDRIHRDAILSFAEPERMGLIRSREEVAGFEAHEVATLSDYDSDPAAVKNWQVTRLELVSLLRHSEPRVYMSNTMPRMDQLEEIEHRALNEFEKNALPQLNTQIDLVVDSQPDRIRMLGSVRSSKTCLQCHEGERGKLLGAFSYELVPISAADQTAASLSN